MNVPGGCVCGKERSTVRKKLMSEYGGDDGYRECTEASGQVVMMMLGKE